MPGPIFTIGCLKWYELPAVLSSAVSVQSQARWIPRGAIKNLLSALRRAAVSMNTLEGE